MQTAQLSVGFLARLCAFGGGVGLVTYLTLEFYFRAEAGDPSWYPTALWVALLVGGIGGLAFARHLSRILQAMPAGESSIGRWVWVPVTGAILTSGAAGKLGIGLLGLSLSIVCLVGGGGGALYALRIDRRSGS